MNIIVVVGGISLVIGMCVLAVITVATFTEDIKVKCLSKRR